MKYTYFVDSQVCIQPACKHNHYGGQVCSSCRGFFRRVVMNERAGKLSCRTGKEDCQIDSKSRKSCSWCRYQKCLSAGMRPGWIMTREERRMLREERRQKKCRGTGGTLTGAGNSEKGRKTRARHDHFPSSKVVALKLTQEEAKVIDQAVSIAYRVYFNTMCDILMCDARPVLTVHDLILLQRPTTRPSFIKLLEQNCEHLFRAVFSEAIGHEEEVHPDDREALVAHNYGPFFSVLVSLYQHPPDLAKIIDSFMIHVRRRANEDDVFQMVEEMFSQIASEGKMLAIRYEQVPVRRNLV